MLAEGPVHPDEDDDRAVDESAERLLRDLRTGADRGFASGMPSADSCTMAPTSFIDRLAPLAGDR
jgi:hypothetical protein